MNKLNGQQPIRVLVADDHNVVRRALRTYLDAEPDIQVVGDAANGQELRAMFDRTHADILIMDVEMPHLQPVEFIAWLKGEYPEIEVLILSAHIYPHHVVSLFKVGVAGYVVKDDPSHILIEALRAVYRGDGWISPQVARVLAEQLRTPTAPNTPLSDREREVLIEVGRGYSNSVIADELTLSDNTVRNHIARIYEKLHVSSRVEAIVVALRAGIISLDDLADQTSAHQVKL